MAFGVKVKLDVEVIGGSKLRSQIQQAVENATQGKPIKIRHLSIDLGRQEAQRISKQLESAIASQDITIKIAKIDASKPVAQLKKQLTTMLSGLSITGLKDFLGADGVASSYDKATAAANKLAEAQENVRKRTEEANVALKTLKTVQSTLNTVFKSSSGVGDQAKLEAYLTTYRELLVASESAKNMQGDAQAAEVIRITAATVALKQQVDAQLDAEKAAKRKAAATKSAEEIARQAAAEQERAAKKEANLSRQAVQLRQRINSWIQNNSKAYAANKAEIDSLLISLQNEAAVSDVALAQLRQRFEEINASARESGIAGKSFFDTLKAGWAKFGGWSLVTKSLMAAVNAVKSMVSAVIALDSAMTELKKVTDLTALSYANFAVKAAQTAKRIGASVADTISATADFARLGYNIEDAAALAEAALIYKNVGDGIDDISIATESLISTLKAFGIEADNAMGVIDMFNEVGNNFAISSSGIGDALQRSASALAAAGNTIEQSIGLVTAMNSVVQNPESVGTALKTLTMYLRAAKTEAEEAGVETDGMADSVAELRGELMDLTGIDIMLDEDTFKSTYQILKEISDVWADLTDVSQSNVLNLLGGKRNANVIASLITNFEDAEEAMKSAMNSLGSATAENEKYIDSINGKIAVLKATFEELSSNVVNSNMVKALLDIANAIMNAVTWLSKANLLLPAITASVMTIRGAMNGFKAMDATRGIASIFSRASGMSDIGEATSLTNGAIKTALEGLTNAQKRLAVQQIESAIASSDMSEALKTQATTALRAATSTKALAGAGNTLSVAIKGISAAFKSWQVWLLIVEALIWVVSTAIDGHNKKIQESIDKAHELSDAYSEARDTYTSNTKTLHSLEEEFNRLSAGVDANGNNVSLTANEYERYLSIIDQIVDISPSIVSGYDDQGRAIMNYKDALVDAIAEQERYIENQRNIYLSSGKEIFEGTANEYKEWQKELGKQGKKIGSAVTDPFSFMEAGSHRSIFAELDLDFGVTKTWETAYDELLGMYELSDELMVLLRNSGLYTEEELTRIETAIAGVAGAYTQLSAIEAEQINYLMEFSKGQDWYGNIPVGAIDEFRTGLVGINDPLKSYNQNMQAAAIYGRQFADAMATADAQDLSSMAKGLTDGTVSLEEYNEAVAAFRTTLEELGMGSVADAVITYFSSLTNSARQGSASTDEYTASVSSLSDALSALTKGYDILNKAKEEMSEGGGISADTISSIATMLGEGEKITDYLTYENGLIKLNEEAWKTRAASMMTGNIAAIEKQIADLQTENAALSQVPEDAWANSELIDQNTESIAALNEELELYRAIYNEIVNGSTDPMNLSTMISGLDSIGNKAKGLLSVLKDLENGTAMSAGEMANLSLQYEELFGMAPEYDLTTLEGQKSAIEAIISAYEAEFDAIIDTQIAELETAKTREGITEAEIAAIDAKIARLNTLKGLELSDIYGDGEDTVTKQTERYGELTDAINGVSKAIKLLTDIQSGEGDTLDMLQTVVGILQDAENLDLEDFISGFSDAGGIDWNEEAIRSWSDSLVDAVPGIEELNEKFPGLTQYLKDMAVAEIEATTEAEKLATAFDNVSKVLDFVSNLDAEGNDPLEMIQTATELAGLVEGTDWTSWVSGFDKATGAISWNEEAIKSFTGSLVDAIPNLQTLEDTFPGITDYLKENAFAAAEAEVSYEALSDAISGVGKAADLLTEIHSGSTDILGMLDAVVEMAEQSGQSLDKFFTVTNGEFVWNEETIRSWSDALVEKIRGLPGVTDEAIEAIKAMARAEVEAATASDLLSQAISGVKTASSLLTDIKSGEGDTLDMLQTVADMAQQSGQSLNEFFTISGTEIKWDEDAIVDWAGNLVDRLSQVVEISPEVQAYLKGMIAAEIEAATAAERMEAAYSNMQAAAGSHGEYGGYTQITYEDYQSLIEADHRYAAAVEYQNGVMVLNGAKHDEITAKILEETRAMAMAEKQAILMSDEYQELRRNLDAGLLTEGEDLQRLLDLETQIKGYDVLAKEIDNATSAYYRWLNRKGDDGMDRYSQAMSAFELIDDTLNDKESEYYGRIGREEFGLAVDFVLGEHVELNTPEFDRAMKLAERYLTEGAEGAGNFYDDLVSHGLLDATTGALDSSIAEIAKTLGVSEEMVRTMIDRINEYQEEANKIEVTEPEVSVSTEDTETALDQVITSLESANEYISTISETPLVIAVQEEEKTTTGLTMISDMLEAIKTSLATILQNPMAFNVDDLYSSVQSIFGYLAEIGTAIETANGLELDIDGSGSVETLDALNSAAEVVVTSLTAISNILTAIIASRDGINKQGISITTGRTSSLLGSVSSSLSSIIGKLNQIKANSNITIRINEITTKTTKTSGGSFWSNLFGSASVSGNAAVRGTAMAAGGNTLVGELGMETVVDPATNTWYTVGERGAEFVKLPKNAVVFNHKQTEELFGTGHIDSRGDALASGNAAISLKDIVSKAGSVISTVSKVASAVSKTTSSTKKTTTSTSSSSSKSVLSGIVSGISNAVSNVVGAVSSAVSGVAAGVGAFVNGISDAVNGSGVQRPGGGTSSGGNKTGGSTGGSSGGGSKEENKLEKLKEQYEELNKQTEHLIAHQEFLYKQAEKGLNYPGMEQSLQNQAELYKKIMSDSQAAVTAMIAAGASDTDEELQAMEEAYWSAYESLYDTLDQINSLYVDALNEKIDGIQSAYENLKVAAEEFNSGGITVDTFQALIENGVQYMSLLDNINGQYVINTEGIQRMIAAQKEQLAIESALSYLQKLKTALADGETNAVAALVNMTETLGTSTWDAVYAQAALLRGSGGLTEAQYAQVIANIDALRAIAAAVNTDITASAQDNANTQAEKNEAQIDALEEILSLTEDLIKAEAEERIEALEDEIDAYQKIIDLKKESLRASKEEDNYTKNVAQKTGEIAKIQARIDQLKLDDSREARAERARLEEELAGLQSDLGDLQSDHSYDMQESALDQAAQEFEDARQQEIEAIEDSISSAEKLYQAALERLNSSWDTLYDDLIAWNTEMGSSLNSEITENWLAAAEAVQLYGSYLQAVNGLKQEQESASSTGSSNTVATGTPTTIPTAPSAPSTPPASERTEPTPSEPEPEPIKKVKVVDGRWNVRTGPSTSKKILGVVGEGTVLEYRGQTSGNWYAVRYKNQDAWINNGGSKLIEELPQYHQGGVAGDKATLKDNEVLSVLEEGELVLTDKMKKAAYKLIDFKDYLEKKLGTAIGSVSAPLPQLPALAGVGALGNGGVDIGQMNFSPTIQVEINHSGAMSDKDARQYGKTIADTAMNELYEGFRQRGIGKIFGTKPTQ